MKYFQLHCNGTKDNKPLAIFVLCAVDVNADELQITEVRELTKEEYDREMEE